MELNVGNTNLETKYRINQEDGNECWLGKEDLSITYKSHTLELSHQFVIAKSYFWGFHPWAWIHEKTKSPIIQASNDLWSPQDSTSTLSRI